MSEENVDRFLKSTEAFNRGDVEGWLEGSHPDVVFEVQLGRPGGRLLRARWPEAVPR
jgi:hypothetical protein